MSELSVHMSYYILKILLI